MFICNHHKSSYALNTTINRALLELEIQTYTTYSSSNWYNECFTHVDSQRSQNQLVENQARRRFSKGGKHVETWRHAEREREWTFGMREWFSYHIIIWLYFFIYNRNRVAIFDQQYSIPSQPIQTWQVACSLTLYLQTTI